MKFHFCFLSWVYEKWNDGTVKKMNRTCSICEKVQYRVYNDYGISNWITLYKGD